MLYKGMRRVRSWQIIAGCLVLGGVLAAVVVFWVHPRSEPVYAGRALSEWLPDFDLSSGPRLLLASNAIHQMGPAAVPHLGPMLRVEDSPMKLRLLRLLGKVGIKTDFVPADRHRERAARACGVLGPAAAQYLPELTSMLDTWHSAIASSAYEAILKVKPRNECVPELIKTLTNHHAELRWTAAGMLGDLKTEDPAAIAALNQALKDPEAQVRKDVLRAFYLTDVRSAHCSNAALAQLTDNNADVRQLAIQILARIRPNSQEAKERIMACSTDPDPVVRGFVLGNYQGLGLDTTDLLRIAENYARDSNAEVRVVLTHRLGNLWRQSSKAKTLLERCLEDEDARVRSAAESYLKRKP
jgi:HEAT repeat protein/putative sister chromatid cohesion protein